MEKLRERWKNPRLRIVLWASLVGLFFALCPTANSPMEDLIIAARNMVRSHRSDGRIVMVLQDDRTVAELKTSEIGREYDARVADALLKAGARRVFFQWAYTHTAGPQLDGELAEVVARYPDKIFFGVPGESTEQHYNYVSSVPLNSFGGQKAAVSLAAMFHTSNMGISLLYYSNSAAGKIPSMPAKIAEIKSLPDGEFRPDFSIQADSIPDVSYIDVLNDKFDADVIAGRDVIIDPSAAAFGTTRLLLGQGHVPGGYFYAIAAETLRNGIPIRLGAFPALILALAVVLTGMQRGSSLDAKRVVALIAILIVFPFVCDMKLVEVDVFPAIAATGIALFRMRSLDKLENAGETNAGSGLPSVQALRNQNGPADRILVALKIRNYGAIIGSFAQPVEAQVAAEVVRRIRISDPDVVVYHEGGMYLWLSSIRSPFDLMDNLEGLHRIVQSGIQIAGRDIDLSFNCGFDSEFDRPVAGRVSNAMQASEEAVRNDELVYQHDSRKHEAHWEISLLTSLDRAIDNGEVWVAYQPKLDLASNRITGMEALVRWSHPERGPISPEKFIRIAEEYHRIERITRFVLDEAVGSAVKLRRLGFDLIVSVNISAQLLRNPGLPEMIRASLQTHGLAPANLMLEITETDRLDRSSRTFRMLQSLVEMGLKLSIDDFGTGNATIDYLRYLPAGEVKIDKVFISAMENNREDYLLVQSIIEMAHSLERKVVAEGVESAAVLDLLKRLRCDQIQGYYISRPVAFDDFITMMGRRETLRTG
ncbi:EAL domain-containing protein [Novosphingobium colocasiae]|uniref:EAL domain-containing protein n=1 Tax=Novosphingobium colocasiae TaxID=1256513 RepID=A0A918PGP4_9SPHN|nr:EAL domain-containing protein [Novosphingobium colocasiae]GGZ08427.1 hypothetical protein GCM10011614_24120 [Novosphingobium colocasiae]